MRTEDARGARRRPGAQGLDFRADEGQKAASPPHRAERAPPTPQPDQGASRVIILSPALTEMVCAMNAQDRIVGVGEFCVYPPRSLNYPRAAESSASYEIMESLEPDLVIVQGLRYDRAVCKAAGIPLDVLSTP